MSIAKPRLFWPLVIDASNQVITFVQGGTINAAVAASTYIDSDALVSAIASALAATGAAPGLVVAISSDGVISISLSLPWTLKCTAGSFTAYWIGVNSAADIVALGAGPYTVTCAFQVSNSWYSSNAVREDSLVIRDRGMNVVTRAQSGQTKFITQDELSNRILKFSYNKPERTYKQYEGLSNASDAATKYNRAIERLWENGYSRFRYWPDGSASAVYSDLVLDSDTLKQFAPSRMYTKKALYEFTLKCWGYVP